MQANNMLVGILLLLSYTIPTCYGNRVEISGGFNESCITCIIQLSNTLEGCTFPCTDKRKLQSISECKYEQFNSKCKNFNILCRQNNQSYHKTFAPKHNLKCKSRYFDYTTKKEQLRIVAQNGTYNFSCTNQSTILVQKYKNGETRPTCILIPSRVNDAENGTLDTSKTTQSSAPPKNTTKTTVASKTSIFAPKISTVVRKISTDTIVLTKTSTGSTIISTGTRVLPKTTIIEPNISTLSPKISTLGTTVSPKTLTNNTVTPKTSTEITVPTKTSIITPKITTDITTEDIISITTSPLPPFPPTEKSTAQSTSNFVQPALDDSKPQKFKPTLLYIILSIGVVSLIIILLGMFLYFHLQYRALRKEEPKPYVTWHKHQHGENLTAENDINHTREGIIEEPNASRHQDGVPLENKNGVDLTMEDDINHTREGEHNESSHQNGGPLENQNGGDSTVKNDISKETREGVVEEPYVTCSWTRHKGGEPLENQNGGDLMVKNYIYQIREGVTEEPYVTCSWTKHKGGEPLENQNGDLFDEPLENKDMAVNEIFHTMEENEIYQPLPNQHNK